MHFLYSSTHNYEVRQESFVEETDTVAKAISHDAIVNFCSLLFQSAYHIPIFKDYPIYLHTVEETFGNNKNIKNILISHHRK